MHDITKIEMEKRIQKVVQEGWILIGEIEYDKKSPFPTFDNEPFFLYVRCVINNNICEYCYSICKGLLSIRVFDYFSFSTRYSINTILCWYISADRDHGRLPSGHHLVTTSHELKIRLVGYRDWIEVDDDFLHNRINLDELELRFRSDKEERHINYLKSIDTEDVVFQEKLKNYKIIT